MKHARFVLSLVVCVAGIMLLASVVQAQNVCPTPSSPDVTTWHNDNCRTGWQQHETILSASGDNAVNQNNFGLVAQWNGTAERSMGRVFAEPLAVSNLPTVTGEYTQNCNNPCNLVLIADENDMLWAYNAGSTSAVPVWSIDLALEAGGIAPIDCQTMVSPFAPCENGVLGNSVGATGTGVIDESNSNRPHLYLVAVVDMSGIPAYFIYDVDIVGGDVAQYVQITTAQPFPGKNPSNAQLDNICTSDYSQNSGLNFDYNHIQRGGLLLFDGVVYVPFSPGDSEWENGWLFGYSLSPLQQTAAFVTTPYGTGGGIWGSGAGPATDGTYIYTVTANGTWDMVAGNSIPVDLGSSVLRLLPNVNSFTVSDFYTPSDVYTYVPPLGSHSTGRCLNDTDLGSGGLMIFPDQFYNPTGKHPLAVVADKESNIYVIDTTDLGQFTSGVGTNFEGNNVETITTPPALTGQPLPNGQGYWGSGAYWKSQSGGNTNYYYLYYTATSHNATVAPYPVYQYTLQASGSPGPITNTAAVASHLSTGLQVQFCLYSPTPSVSSNGSSGVGILWAVESANLDNPIDCNGTPEPAVLHAFDAASMQQIYTSNGNSHITAHATYPTPTIFNGQVYVGTWVGVDVFGLCGISGYPVCLE